MQPPVVVSSVDEVAGDTTGDNADESTGDTAGESQAEEKGNYSDPELDGIHPSGSYSSTKDNSRSATPIAHQQRNVKGQKEIKVTVLPLN